MNQHSGIKITEICYTRAFYTWDTAHMKGKVKLSRCLTNKHHTIKGMLGVEVWLHAFLNSALDGGE